ncbi:MAG: glucose-1-phosphate adenylyltransferase [Planctomycetes bacterium]|nr:glucose-1-phosphate adenylyltransferase [Planctomycetota bacterium]
MKGEDYLDKTLSIVLAGGQGERLYPLTRDRAKPAVPFGGSFRVIDFTLSNCINSGLRRIEVLTQYKSYSLARHLRLGWSFLNSSLGEYVNNSPPQQRLSKAWYQGTADAIFQNIYTLQIERPEHVLILGGDHIYKMDYRKMISEHIKKKAAVTVAAQVVPCAEASSFGVIQKDIDGRIVGFQEKPAKPRPMPEDPEKALISMGIYVFNAEILVKRLIDDARTKGSSHDFGKDILPTMVENGEPVFVHAFGGGNSKFTYWRDIGTLDAYWQSHMDLLDKKSQLNLYDRHWPIFTHQLRLPPPFFKKSAEIERSIVSAGSVVSSAKVVDSVVGSDVNISHGASISGAVIMDRVRIGANAVIKNAILDKDVVVPEGAVIDAESMGKGSGFTITKMGIIVIPKGESV